MLTQNRSEDSSQTAAPEPGNLGSWHIPSALTVYAADELRGQMLEKLRQTDIVNWDLGAVETCDCAGLQLLCAAQKSARLAGKRLNIINCSSAVSAAALEIGLTSDKFLNTTPSL